MHTLVVVVVTRRMVRIWAINAHPRLRLLHRVVAGPAPLTAVGVWSDPDCDIDQRPEAPLVRFSQTFFIESFSFYIYFYFETMDIFDVHLYTHSHSHTHSVTFRH